MAEGRNLTWVLDVMKWWALLLVVRVAKKGF